MEITVCIPVYNGARYLDWCIASVLEQQFKGRFEILLIDDCSTDNSYDLAQQYQRENKDIIRVLRNKINEGLVRNWNICVKEAKGEWIKFLFQDDWMHPLCLQKMYDRAKDDKSCFVICNRSFFIEENSSSKLNEFYTNEIITLKRYYSADTFISPSVNQSIARKHVLANYLGEPICFLYQKNLTETFGEYNEALSQLCDYEYAQRIVSHTGFSYINEALVTFRVSASSASHVNHANNKVQIKYIEPLLLLHLFIWSKYYKKLRAGIPVKFLLRMYLFYMKQLNKSGIKKVNQLLNSYYHAFPFLHLHKLYFILYKTKHLFKRSS